MDRVPEEPAVVLTCQCGGPGYSDIAALKVPVPSNRIQKDAVPRAEERTGLLVLRLLPPTCNPCRIFPFALYVADPLRPTEGVVAIKSLNPAYNNAVVPAYTGAASAAIRSVELITAARKVECRAARKIPLANSPRI